MVKIITSTPNSTLANVKCFKRLSLVKILLKILGFKLTKHVGAKHQVNDLNPLNYFLIN